MSPPTKMSMNGHVGGRSYLTEQQQEALLGQNIQPSRLVQFQVNKARGH